MNAVLRRVGRFLRLFFCGDPYPQTPATIARAKEDQLAERTKYRVDCDGHPLLIRGLGEIGRATRDNMLHFNSKRRQELDATLDTVTTLTRERIH